MMRPLAKYWILSLRIKAVTVTCLIVEIRREPQIEQMVLIPGKVTR